MHERTYMNPTSLVLGIRSMGKINAKWGYHTKREHNEDHTRPDQKRGQDIIVNVLLIMLPTFAQYTYIVLSNVELYPGPRHWRLINMRINYTIVVIPYTSPSLTCNWPRCPYHKIRHKLIDSNKYYPLMIIFDQLEDILLSQGGYMQENGHL